MKNNTLLLLHASARSTRSLTRHLARRFARTWTSSRPAARIVERDLGAMPPPAIDEAWIDAAFTHEAERTAEQNVALALSETLIEEIATADVIVLGTPVYNFGPPAALKAWFDQVIRIGRTFAIEPAAADPYRPLLAAKPVVILAAASDANFFPGGACAQLNFLEPHVTTMLELIGLRDLSFVRISERDAETPDHPHSISSAEAAVDALAFEIDSGTGRTEGCRA